MTGKSELLTRLQYLESAAHESLCIDDGIDHTSSHNGVANLLRKGLGIVAFNILEDFVKNSAAYFLKNLAQSGVKFSNLPPILQQSSTMEALKSIQFQARLAQRNNEDWLTLVQTEALRVHSTSKENYEFSTYTVFSQNSNISADEIAELLKIFGIANGWAKLQAISNAISGGVPDLQQAYRNASSRRNKAAHTANFRYEHGWLVGVRSEIISIAAAIDIILSAKCRQVRRNNAVNIDSHTVEDALNYRFLEESSMGFREMKTVGGRCLKTWPHLADAITAIRPKLEQRDEFLVVLDARRRICDWHLG